MKKHLFYAFAAIAALFMTSCSFNDDEIMTLPNLYAYATAMEAEATDDDSASDDIYFAMDNGDTFYINENKTSFDYNTMEIGERVVLGVRIYDSEDERYDNSATLYEVIKVVQGEHAKVTTEEENKAIPNDALSIISKSASLTYGYLNLYVGFVAKDYENVKFYLVNNKIVSETSEDDDDKEKVYMELELRYDNAGTEDKGTACKTYLSFDMSSYYDTFKDIDGIELKVKLSDDESTVLKIDGNKLFEF